jgi:hypothetical protein
MFFLQGGTPSSNLFIHLLVQRHTVNPIGAHCDMMPQSHNLPLHEQSVGTISSDTRTLLAQSPVAQGNLEHIASGSVVRCSHLRRKVCRLPWSDVACAIEDAQL